MKYLCEKYFQRNMHNSFGRSEIIFKSISMTVQSEAVLTAVVRYIMEAQMYTTDGKYLAWNQKRDKIRITIIIAIIELKYWYLKIWYSCRTHTHTRAQSPTFMNEISVRRKKGTENKYRICIYSTQLLLQANLSCSLSLLLSLAFHLRKSLWRK